jgi:hypothetical protein
MQGELPGLRAAEDARKQAEAAERAEREKENQRVKAEQEDWNRLIEQRSKFKEQFLTGIDVSPDIKHQRFSRF